MVMVPRKAASPTSADHLTGTESSQQTARLLNDRSSNTPHLRGVANRQNLPELALPVESPYSPGASENEQWITDRTAELDRLSALDDSTSMKEILSELRNPLPEIRRAALSAVRAFSSRKSIPYLDQIRRETRDSSDQQNLTNAIDYLKLPTMVEALAQ